MTGYLPIGPASTPDLTIPLGADSWISSVRSLPVTGQQRISVNLGCISRLPHSCFSGSLRSCVIRKLSDNRLSCTSCVGAAGHEWVALRLGDEWHGNGR